MTILAQNGSTEERESRIRARIDYLNVKVREAKEVMLRKRAIFESDYDRLIRWRLDVMKTLPTQTELDTFVNETVARLEAELAEVTVATTAC